MYRPGVSSTSCHTRLCSSVHPVVSFAPKRATNLAQRSLCSVSVSASSRVVASGVVAANKSRGHHQTLYRPKPFTLTPTYRHSTSSLSTSSFSPSQNRLFSSTPIAMTATKIDGTAIAKSIREKIHAEIEATQKINPRYKPSLKIIQGKFLCNLRPSERFADIVPAVGERSDSSM